MSPVSSSTKTASNLSRQFAIAQETTDELVTTLVREGRTLAVVRASMLLMVARWLGCDGRVAETFDGLTCSTIDNLPATVPADHRIDCDVQRSEQNFSLGQDDVAGLLAVFELYLRNAGVIAKLKAIINDQHSSIDAKLRRLDEVLPLPDGITATELARAFGVSRQSVAKTSWWRERRNARSYDADERLSKLRTKGRGIDPGSYDGFSDDNVTLAG